MSEKEAGAPTAWDIAFREGYAKALREGHHGKPWWTGKPNWATTQNRSGEWVPSIPEPFYGLRKRCSGVAWEEPDPGGYCKRRFWTKGGYRAHYALEHILDLP